VRDRLIDETGFVASKTVTVNNGVDCRRFHFDADAGRRYRRGLGIPDDAVVFGAIGRIHNGQKRHDLSLRLFARLADEHQGVPLRFLLVGEGPDRGEILSLAQELGVASRFILAPFTPDSWEAHNALDVFLIPSVTESFGLALAEAMATERCVVGMAVEGIGEILSEIGIGLPAPPDDEDAFYAAMKTALQMGPVGRAEMGRRARESVQRRFDADQQYARIIAHVLGDE
jgi:glycosyltransferase involved in cell wall biosynthesis